MSNPTKPEAEGPLSGREVLVCVCGGIAAFKSAALVSQLVQRDCGVTVAMTRNANRFIGRTTFEALTGRPVVRSMWSGGGRIQHLRHSETADLKNVGGGSEFTLVEVGNLKCTNHSGY